MAPARHDHDDAVGRSGRSSRADAAGSAGSFPSGRSVTAGLRVITAGRATTIQDRGRTGLAHLGVPRAGAVDVAAADLANRLVGNALGAAVLETNGGLVVEAGRPLVVATSAGGHRSTLAFGDRVDRGASRRSDVGLPGHSRRRRRAARARLALSRHAVRPRTGGDRRRGRVADRCRSGHGPAR